MTIADVDHLALRDPDTYDRLLAGYFRLLGDGKLWWQRCDEAALPGWDRAMRKAITFVAEGSKIAPERLAAWLDGTLPQTRELVHALACEYLEREDARG